MVAGLLVDVTLVVAVVLVVLVVVVVGSRVTITFHVPGSSTLARAQRWDWPKRICVYTRLYIDSCTCVCPHILCVHAYIFVFVHASVCTYVCICMYAHAYCVANALLLLLSLWPELFLRVKATCRDWGAVRSSVRVVDDSSEFTKDFPTSYPHGVDLLGLYLLMVRIGIPVVTTTITIPITIPITIDIMLTSVTNTKLKMRTCHQNLIYQTHTSHIHTHIRARTHTYTHTPMHTYTHTHIHSYTHTHTFQF